MVEYQIGEFFILILNAQIFLIYYDVLDEYGKSVIWDKFLERYPSVTWKNLPSEQAVFAD